jgi:3',5'-cyclic-AMP phosphodiesterase
MPTVMVIAHLSDPHLDGGERSTARAARVMTYLAGLDPRPDVVLVTGDLADNGLVTEYEQLRSMLGAAVPGAALCCPGNHDDRAAYRKGLLDHDDASTAPVNSAHQVAGVTFLMCDSSIPGRNEGTLDDTTLDWLDAELAAAPGLPAFVCLHHPPVDLHHPLVDDIRLLDEQRLAAVLDRHPQVVAVLCGHAHTPAVGTFAGRPVLVAPGIASTMRLPWEPGPDPDLDAPPGVAFHVLDDHRRLTTHYRVVPVDNP